jgi:hypothetical protein
MEKCFDGTVFLCLMQFLPETLEPKQYAELLFFILGQSTIL